MEGRHGQPLILPPSLPTLSLPDFYSSELSFQKSNFLKYLFGNSIRPRLFQAWPLLNPVSLTCVISILDRLRMCYSV